MDSSAADRFASRLAARFPTARVSKDTLSEWSGEFSKLTEDRAELVLEWIADNVETAPSFKQIRLAMAKADKRRRDPESWKQAEAGVNDPCEFCGQPVPAFGDSAARYDAEFDRWANAHLSCLDARKEQAVALSRSESPGMTLVSLEDR